MTILDIVGAIAMLTGGFGVGYYGYRCAAEEYSAGDLSKTILCMVVLVVGLIM